RLEAEREDFPYGAVHKGEDGGLRCSGQGTEGLGFHPLRKLVEELEAKSGLGVPAQADSFCSSSSLAVAWRMTGSLFLKMTSSEMTTSLAVFIDGMSYMTSSMAVSRM